MNSIQLIGTLCRDPEIKFANSGTAICDLSIAYNEKYTKANGEKVDRAHFFGVVMFGKTAEAFAKYHHKGDRCLIEGCLVMEEWEKDGKKQTKTKIRADRWHFLPRSDRAGSHQEAPRTARATQAPQPVSKIDPHPDDQPADDVPF
jgi:single-strand DNA-binding protein